MPTAARSGIGVRMTDGLGDPQDDLLVPFYPPDYRSDLGTLPFCGALPDNPLGLCFTLPPVWKMCEDALLKVHELPRALLWE